VLCERGIKTFETATPILWIGRHRIGEEWSHLPVIAIPHTAPHAQYGSAMSKAAVRPERTV